MSEKQPLQNSCRSRLHYYGRRRCVPIMTNKVNRIASELPAFYKRILLLIYRKLQGSSKNSFFAIFSRLRRVVTRLIIASYNIAFSKLPLKTEVFRGSLQRYPHPVANFRNLRFWTAPRKLSEYTDEINS